LALRARRQLLWQLQHRDQQLRGPSVSGSNNIYIGNNVDGGVPDEFNTIRIGGANQTSAYIAASSAGPAPRACHPRELGGKLGSSLVSPL
jgi:hypothetical protein